MVEIAIIISIKQRCLDTICILLSIILPLNGLNCILSSELYILLIRSPLFSSYWIGMDLWKSPSNVISQA